MNAPPMAPAVVLLDYDKVQRDEVEVLKSIFMDDYEHVETMGVWNVSWPFKITYVLFYTQCQKDKVLMCTFVSDRNPILRSNFVSKLPRMRRSRACSQLL